MPAENYETCTAPDINGHYRGRIISNAHPRKHGKLMTNLTRQNDEILTTRIEKSLSKEKNN